jgi:hypothetical protein
MGCTQVFLKKPLTGLNVVLFKKLSKKIKQNNRVIAKGAKIWSRIVWNEKNVLSRI